MGGEDQQTYALVDSVVVYDPERDSWAPGPSLPPGLSGGRAVMHEGELHLLHREVGQDRTRHCVYRNGAWQEVAGTPPGLGRSLGSLLLG